MLEYSLKDMERIFITIILLDKAEKSSCKVNFVLNFEIVKIEPKAKQETIVILCFIFKLAKYFFAF